MANFQQTIGFIGSGRMATALAQGCQQSGLVSAEQIYAADPSSEALANFSKQVPGAQIADSNQQLLAEAQIVVLAVKPQIMPEVLSEIARLVSPEHLLVSIAAGVTLQKLATDLPENTRLVRVMPNTPCLVGLGTSCYSLGEHATDADGQAVRQILESVGKAFPVDEPQLDAVTGLSGSGPAFIYRVIEALIAGGVASGLPAELALQLAANTTRGAAEMVISTGKSPEELCQQVTSPGGTTLAGLEAYDQAGAGNSLTAAVEAATHRSIELGQA